jgi:hypothetical protein
LLVEFSSVVDALRCVTEVQAGMVEGMLVFLPTGASSSVSAPTWAMSSSRTGTSSVTA